MSSISYDLHIFRIKRYSVVIIHRLRYIIDQYGYIYASIYTIVQLYVTGMKRNKNQTSRPIRKSNYILSSRCSDKLFDILMYSFLARLYIQINRICPSLTRACPLRVSPPQSLSSIPYHRASRRNQTEGSYGTSRLWTVLNKQLGATLNEDMSKN